MKTEIRLTDIPSWSPWRRLIHELSRVSYCFPEHVYVISWTVIQEKGGVVCPESNISHKACLMSNGSRPNWLMMKYNYLRANLTFPQLMVLNAPFLYSLANQIKRIQGY